MKMETGDLIICYHNYYYPMIVMDGKVATIDGRSTVSARSIGMRIDYNQPLKKIKTNCGKMDFMEFYRTIDSNRFSI